MSYRTKAQHKTRNATLEQLLINDGEIDPNELKGHIEDLDDSVQWTDPVLPLADGPVVPWNFATSGEARLTAAGNRTLNISNLPADHVVYGTLEFIQDNIGGRTLTLPGPLYKATVGTINPAANSVSEIFFRWNGAAFSFKIS